MAQQINGEQLRAEIDSGRTGEKVGFPDPAAAPLGTDAEAGGQLTSFRSEISGTSPSREGSSTLAIWLIALGIIIVAAIAVFIVVSGSTAS
jgi:hypothetical protein